MKIDKQAKGTRILMNAEAELYRGIITTFSSQLGVNGYREVILPLIEPTDIYTDKAGKEILNQMYVFDDKKGRSLCLRPEGTATIQLIQEKLCGKKDVKLFYCTKCWRYERPQAGRYREFTQFGVEWLNPSDPEEARKSLIFEAADFLSTLGLTSCTTWNVSVKRGLSYYVGDGFEASIDLLGGQKQVLGGGSYDGGIGFAFGVDRLMLSLERKNV